MRTASAPLEINRNVSSDDLSVVLQALQHKPAQMSNAPAWQLWVLPEPLDSGLSSLLRFYLIPERNCVLAFAKQEFTYLSFHIPMVCDSYNPVYTGIRGVKSQLACLPGHTFSYFSFFRTAHRCAQGAEELAHLYPLAEDPSSVPSIHVVAHNHQYPVLGDVTLSSGVCRH